MFFFLAQILSFLFTPLIWIVVLILLSFFIKNKARSRRLLLSALIVAGFFTNSLISVTAVHIWEYPVTPDKNLAKYDVGIVLGGGMVTNDVENNRLTFRNNTDRILQGVSLYK